MFALLLWLAALPFATITTQLGHPDYRQREAATRQLHNGLPYTLGAAWLAARSPDAEVRARATDISAKLDGTIDRTYLYYDAYCDMRHIIASGGAPEDWAIAKKWSGDGYRDILANTIRRMGLFGGSVGEGLGAFETECDGLYQDLTTQELILGCFFHARAVVVSNGGLPK